jgi:hypothetical protein
MQNFTVRLYFNSYNLPLVYHISDPKEGMKATVIPGTRGDGVIVIPGGKRSQEITVKGYLVNHSGYESLTSDISTLKSSITTENATLTLQHYTGATWVSDWAYTVRRLDEIEFPESLRTDYQEYIIRFLVIAY